MSSEYLDSRRRKRAKKGFRPFNIVPLTKERADLEERRIREAYDREATKEEHKDEQE